MKGRMKAVNECIKRDLLKVKIRHPRKAKMHRKAKCTVSFQL